MVLKLCPWNVLSYFRSNAIANSSNASPLPPEVDGTTAGLRMMPLQSQNDKALLEISIPHLDYSMIPHGWDIVKMEDITHDTSNLSFDFIRPEDLQDGLGEVKYELYGAQLETAEDELLDNRNKISNIIHTPGNSCYWHVGSGTTINPSSATGSAYNEQHTFSSLFMRNETANEDSIANFISENHYPQYNQLNYCPAADLYWSRDPMSSGTTPELVPRGTAEVQGELDVVRLFIQVNKIRDNTIEDEIWNVSMVTEYDEEIFQYMRELEVNCLFSFKICLSTNTPIS
jgi:hypothetical protein